MINKHNQPKWFWELLKIKVPKENEVINIKDSKFKIINSISSLMKLEKDRINLKGKTAEKLGLIGKEKAIACEVIVSITKYD